VIIGLDCVAQYNSAGLAGYGAPTWVAIPTVSDVTLSIEAGKASVAPRCTAGWQAYRQTLRDLSIEFDIRDLGKDPISGNTDLAFAYLMTAFMQAPSPTAAVIDVYFSDMPVATSGAQGPRAIMLIESISRKEPLEDATVYTVKLAAAYGLVSGVYQPPVWKTV